VSFLFSVRSLFFYPHLSSVFFINYSFPPRLPPIFILYKYLYI
jgi:hypothetical protein